MTRKQHLVRHQRSARKPQRPRGFQFEQLESRTLLSLTIGGITIPGIPSIPGLPSIPGIPSLTNFPAITNEINLSSLKTFTSPNPNDYWWLSNTGQTLTSHPSGPATGTPGDDVNALNAWNISTGNSNVVIAVLDTGIDLNNADLDSVLWTNPGNLSGDTFTNDIHGWNFINNNNNVQDNFVHGTAVAAAIHSVAPGVTILPVEIGTAAGVNSQDLVNGINYLIMLKKAGVNIVAINASYISYTAPTTDEVNAIKKAGSAGMLYDAAAGNGGLNLDSLIPNIPLLSKFIPSFLPSNLIFVAATDNQDHLASFSDYGANLVAVGAPGVDMVLPIPGGLYAPLSGTSFAAPMVSAIAGLIASKFPNATMAQMKAAILNSGDPDPSLAGKTITGRRVDAFNALNYMMGNKPPTGDVEVLNNTTVSGWAFDPNLGTAPVTVNITMDGTLIDTTTANTTRDDLTAQLGSSDHGFSFDLSNVPYGKHTIKVYAVDSATSKQTQIGSGTIVVDTDPTGVILGAGSKTVTGWAEDPDTLAKGTQVKLYLDGKAWLTTTANQASPDAPNGTSHGFTFKLPAMKAGIHRVDAYAVDSLTGALTLIGSETVSSNQAATGAVETLNATTLSGWAFDPDAGSSAIQVEYQIDDFAPVFVTASGSRPDLQATLGSKNHGFSIALPQLMAGDHTVQVWVVDANDKMLTPLADQTITVADPDGDSLPTGVISDFGGSLIDGTLTDTGSTAPIRARVDVDGKAGKPFVTTATDTDGTYAFSYTPNPKLTGLHLVDAWAYDDQSNAPVLISQQFLNYAAPSATVESFTATSVTGFAVAPNGTNKQAQLRLDVDGLPGALITANLSRPDQLANVGILKSGFSIAMPDLAPGDHEATLYLIDPVTLQATAVGTLDFST